MAAALKAAEFHSLFWQEVEEYSSDLPPVDTGCIHRHLATRRWSCLTSGLCRVAVVFACAPVAMISSVAHRAGLKNLAYSTWRGFCHGVSYVASDAALQPLIRSINRIRDGELFYQTPETMGICAGISVYFNYLFLKNNTPHDSPRDVLIEIAHQFVMGAPNEAVALHRTFNSVFIEWRKLYKTNQKHLLTLIPGDYRGGKVVYRNRDDLLKLANAPHVIRMVLGREFSDYHVISLIKISNQLMYLFDPAIGLFEFQGEDIPKQINDHLNRAYRTTWKFHAACYARKRPEMNLDHFRNFHLQIFPCSSDVPLPEFNSPDPKDEASAFIPVPPTCRGYLQHLFYEAVDTIKSYL